jgi:hypothetical protein
MRGENTLEKLEAHVMVTGASFSKAGEPGGLSAVLIFLE